MVNEVERYVCPLCNRTLSHNGIKKHLHHYLRNNPICLVCRKEFKDTQQLCTHAHNLARYGDELHAAVYYLAHRYTSRSKMAVLGEKVAMELLVEGGDAPLLLNPYLTERGEWYAQMSILTRRYQQGRITVTEISEQMGLHPAQLASFLK